MADGGGRKQKLRGRYKEYLRHYNPYKFKAARRANRRNLCSQKNDLDPTVGRGDLNKHDREFDDSDVFDMASYCDESSSFLPSGCDVNSSEAVAIQTRTLSKDNQMQDILNIRDPEPEEMLDASLGEDELSNSSYELFIGEENDACLDSVSDIEDHDNLEMTSEQCESEPNDILYSGAPLTSSTSIVLLLTFVTKHKLTREAFNDLLLVIEAHCPRPNNCKMSVKKLLEFVSQAKGDLEKHFYCYYCKAYFGKGTGNCNICGQVISKDDGFFIEVPVEKQLKTFFTGKFLSFFCSLKSCLVMTTITSMAKFIEFQHLQYTCSSYTYMTFTLYIHTYLHEFIQVSKYGI